MTTLYLVRHAVTADTGKRLTGWTQGVSLTDEGRVQARAVAAALAGVPFKGLYSSPIDRTLETAKAIAEGHGLSVRTRRGLGEIDYGTWTDRPLKLLARTKLWQRVMSYPSGVRFPEGETLREAQTRAIDEIEKIHDEHPKGPVCCVSHGDVIKLVLAHYLGVHIDLYQRIVVAPASVSLIVLGPQGPRVWGVNVPANALENV
ncbi:MAG TPA: MSMEG_4193 family putative phosphomutase [Actinomycetota bacterium]|nr:MSMEG_4193 family putative phosphomutase [Actinomycetota bacterium]